MKNWIKNVTVTQWITLFFAIASIIVSRLENLGMSVQVVATIWEILLILKLIYDEIRKRFFSEAEAVDFGNYMVSEERNFSVSKNKSRNVTHADLENWKAKNK